MTRVRVGLLLLLCACDGGALTLTPASAIMLRVQAAPAVVEAGHGLVVRIARQRGAKWDERERYERDFDRIDAWPVDLPVVPEGAEDGKRALEFVVEAHDADGHVLAQARAITRFAPHEQRLLQVILDACGERALREVCEPREDCHGERCQSCRDGECLDTSPVEPGALPPFRAHDPVRGLDAGPRNTPVDASAEARQDGDGEAGACMEGEAWCVGHTLETCSEGAPVRELCDNVCRDGRCQGECRPGRDPDRCSEQSSRVPLTCREDGAWTVQEAALDGEGECSFSCVEGKCKGQCMPGTKRCVAEAVEVCDADAEWAAEESCAQYCAEARCAVMPSCDEDPRCGRSRSCCSAPWVPGGSFYRGFDGSEGFDVKDAPAQLSGFHLDRYEVTVGRFRRWVESYPNSRPAVGQGRSLSPDDQGWSLDWYKHLPDDKDALVRSLRACEGTTWSDAQGDAISEQRPINCVIWYVAQAFCIWDGGRLPTEAEWNFAAAGGEQQRAYPWSTEGDAEEIGPAQAVFDAAELAPVGSKSPHGDGRWGHADLSGNAQEWVLDWYRESYRIGECIDCVELVPSECRVLRGGAMTYGAFGLRSSARDCDVDDDLFDKGKVGFRCARGTKDDAP